MCLAGGFSPRLRSGLCVHEGQVLIWHIWYNIFGHKIVGTSTRINNIGIISVFTMFILIPFDKAYREALFKKKICTWGFVQGFTHKLDKIKRPQNKKGSLMILLQLGSKTYIYIEHKSSSSDNSHIRNRKERTHAHTHTHTHIYIVSKTPKLVYIKMHSQ
jgi:hypothetical protein